MIQTEHTVFSHRTTRQRTDGFDLHCHPYYECYYFVGGDVRYLVEGVPYKLAPHSLLLMAGGVFHGMRVETDAPYERYTLHLDEAGLPPGTGELLLKPFHEGGIFHARADAHGIAAYFDAIGACAAMQPALREAALPVRVASLLFQVYALWEADRALPEPRAEQALDRQIIAYINASLTRPLTLEGIARHFFISRNQLCRLFARATGTTVAAYIRQRRLALAQQLRAQGQSASEAAANAGFADYSTYYRACRSILRHAPTRGEAV